MNKILRKIKKTLPSSSAKRAPKKSGSLEGRLAELEIRHDGVAQEVAILKAELQLSSVRQQALVDYYETRIDRIYARLSADLAGVGGVSVTVEQDHDIDGRLITELRKVLDVREGFIDIPVEAILTDHLSPGSIRAPLTLQGFRVNRALAAEAGGRIVVAGIEDGKSKTALYGPYKTLLPGKFRISLQCVVPDDAGVADIFFDIYCPTLDEVLGKVRQAKVPAGAASLDIEVAWPTAKSGHELELRVHQRGAARFEILGFDITDLS